MTDTAFLDTNVILRYLLKDHPERSPRSFQLLQRAERREIQLYVTELVIAEVVWILQGTRYGIPRSMIRDLLIPVIQLPGLRLANKGLYQEIFTLYVESKIDYIDAYNVVVMKQLGLEQIYSYDGDFKRITGINRLEP
ncbi:MAG: PIN domain-containing protein [Chloroflexi bacterium]|nr:PIN domain-containing protein [Chloroflexota bacterium]